MAVFTAIAAAAAIGGLALGAYGVVQQRKATEQQAQFQSEAIGLQKKADSFRKQQMDLDATRRRRQITREMIGAGARAETVGTAQGAQFGSALPGAYGGISGRSGVNELGVSQNQELGSSIFGVNAQISDAYRGAADASGRASVASGLTSLGGMLLSNNETLGKVGGYFVPAGKTA